MNNHENANPTDKIWVLAENDAFFLSKMIAELAEKNLVAGIIELRFRRTVAQKLKGLKRLIDMFGICKFIELAVASIIAEAMNWLISKRLFSLRKVSTRNQIFYKVVHAFDQELVSCLDTFVGDTPILVQVSRRVPASFTKKYKMLNKHCSLLPKYKGVYPVFWALLHGEKVQGVTLHWMNEEFDGGEILGQAQIISEGDFFSIYQKLYAASTGLLIDFLTHSNTLQTRNESGTSSYFSFPKTSDRKLFFKKGLRFGSALALIKT